jgi:hypothetical protein
VDALSARKLEKYRRLHALILEEDFGDIKQYKHFLQAQFAGSYSFLINFTLLFNYLTKEFFRIEFVNTLIVGFIVRK